MSYQEDARFVGAFVRGGDWEVGLRVARNIRGKNGVTLTDFAKQAGLSLASVQRYYKAWEKAAAAGVVDPAETLAPDDTYDFQDAGLGKAQWDAYYSDARYGADASTKRPPSKKEVADAIKENPSLIAEAIQESPHAALHAREAIAKRDKGVQQKKNVADPHGKQDAPMQQLVELQMQLRSAKRSLTEALGYVIDIRGVTSTDEVRASISGYVHELRHVLDLIDEAAQGKSLDDELAELLEDEELQ